MLHMMEAVVLLILHVEKMKAIVIKTVIAKTVFNAVVTIAQLDSTSPPMLTVAIILLLPQQQLLSQQQPQLLQVHFCMYIISGWIQGGGSTFGKIQAEGYLIFYFYCIFV